MARPVRQVCVIAFSVAVPLLAALVVINRQEAFRRRMTKSVLVTMAQVVAQLCAFVGVGAGFWHITWVAGVAMLAAGLVAVRCTPPATPGWRATGGLGPGTARDPAAGS
jgi:hypothetical protein